MTPTIITPAAGPATNGTTGGAKPTDFAFPFDPTDPRTFRPLPTHLDLPDTDGAIVENFHELPQSILLTETIRPLLRERHPDGRYCVGLDSGIYWRWTDPPLDGCKSPDWFYVPNVDPMIGGEVRRSYVMWQEIVPPLIAIEYVSRDGSEERDTTPYTGKFWVYEQGIRIPYYAIYDRFRATVEVHELVHTRYRRMTANARGHYPIEELNLELGLWTGRFMELQVPWLRWYDAQGELLPMSDERIERAEERTKKTEERAEKLAAKLRAAGIDPNA